MRLHDVSAFLGGALRLAGGPAGGGGAGGAGAQAPWMVSASTRATEYLLPSSLANHITFGQF